MDIILSDKAKKEIVKYAKYLENTLNFSESKIDKLVTEFENRLRSNIEKRNEHISSIFPMKSKYGKGYKMYVDVQKHRVIFYKEDKDENDNDIIRIHECPHSSELIKYLNKKKIKPIDDADPELLLNFLTVEKEDKVNNETITDEEREEYNKRREELERRISEKKKSSKENTEGKEEDVEDPETGKKVKRIVYTGPKGGRYYKTDNGEKVYIDESLKCLSSFINESSIVSLKDFLNKLVG